MIMENSVSLMRAKLCIMMMKIMKIGMMMMTMAMKMMTMVMMTNSMKCVSLMTEVGLLQAPPFDPLPGLLSLMMRILIAMMRIIMAVRMVW